MNKNELRKLAKKVSLQISSTDLAFFEKSFLAVLPMVTELLREKISSNTAAMEMIISTPLGIAELSKVRYQLGTNVLNKEEIRKNSPLKGLGIAISKRQG